MDGSLGPAPLARFEPAVRLDPARDGLANMERDEDMLRDAVRGAPPTLRMYRWIRPTLTVGLRQRLPETVSLDALKRRGIALARRPTGGRALLHLPDELTYAVAASGAGNAGVRRAYRRVMRVIWSALSEFVNLDPPPLTSGQRDLEPAKLPCLAVATGHEITAGGRKIVSGAQRWSRGAFLQHGSIPWSIRRDLVNELAGLPSDSPIPAVGIAELSHPPPSRSRVADALAIAFRKEFGRR